MKKICIITGGSSGIGLFLVNEFEKNGYKVIVLDIKHNKNNNIDYYYCDLEKIEDIEKTFNLIKEKYGKIHILINNGGISNFNKSILKISSNDIDKLLNTNLRSIILCSKYFIDLNQNEDYGRIINISSTRWNQNEEDWDLYGATKGGIVSLTSSLAISLSKTPITVNCISPGWIQCNDYDKLSVEDHQQHPSQRVGKPRDIFNLCKFLLDEENDFINGTNIVVDGGMSKKMIYK